VGAVAWNGGRGIGEFEYDPNFVRQGFQIAPLAMPLREGVISFPTLNPDTFHGLPGLLADALPDRFGNRIIDAWLARQGRDANDFTPVERLCYMGVRGMGALEFKPAIGPRAGKAIPIEVDELTRLVAEIFRHRTEWVVSLKNRRAEALDTIVRVGTSAGGNRAKAVIAWNPKTQEVRSGQAEPPPGFEPWILKFDGVGDKTLGDPQGFGRVEYAYHKMAVAAGIAMSPCRLLEEGGRAHFMTRRFDRDSDGGKLHMQSLCALAHYDFNAAGAFGYEQAMSVIRQLNLGYPALREVFRRMVFNVLARNQDDHTRNIGFLMDRNGEWRLAPAYDVVWAYNAQGTWTNLHQMTVNGKRDGFTLADLLAVAESFGIKHGRSIVEEVADAVARWNAFAEECDVAAALKEKIATTHRTKLARSESFV
jgi:serine/threonine-protein kinase HipA